ncbi:cytochrome c biogenesis protein CcsA, partial [Planctomycetota bacterium]
VMGHNVKGGLAEGPAVDGKMLWNVFKSLLSITGVALLLNWFRSTKESGVNPFLRHGLGFLGVATGTISLWLWVTGDATYLGNSAMRIMWQLMQSSVGSVVLLGGLFLLFKQRAGVVLLHLGVMLLMFGQWFVASYDVEEQMMLAEGETKSFAQDVRSLELAVIDSNSADHPDQDNVFAVPLMKTGKLSSFVENKIVESEQLPFTIEIVEFLENSSVKLEASTHESAKGDATKWRAVEHKSVSGTAADTMNIPSMYVRIKNESEDLGVYLLSLNQLRMRTGATVSFDAERIDVGETSYDLQLRFRRRYKPYSITLKDVKKEDYLGTSMAREYASEFQLVDEEKGIDRPVKIWMNNPLRFGGETFYQQSYNIFGGQELSTIQIVQNQGWMVPYVACVMCAVAMLFHFGLTLIRFLNRSSAAHGVLYRGSGEVPGPTSLKTEVMKNRKDRDTEPSSGDRAAVAKPTTEKLLLVAIVPLICMTLVVLFLGSRVFSKPATHGEMKLAEFGRLPIAYQGRIKPLDTLARNSLKLLSTKETFKCRVTAKDLASDRVWQKVSKDIQREWPKVGKTELVQAREKGFQGLLDAVASATGKKTDELVLDLETIATLRQPAIRWLIDTIANSAKSADHKVWRITNPEVLVSLNLKRRKGYLYSAREIMPSIQTIETEVRKAKELRAEKQQLNAQQRQLLAFDRKFSYWMLIRMSFQPPDLPPFPTTAEGDRAELQKQMESFIFGLRTHVERFRQMEPPLAIAPSPTEVTNELTERLLQMMQLDPEEFSKWQSYSVVWAFEQMAAPFGQEGNRSFDLLNRILVAYATDESKAFNEAVSEYHRFLQKKENMPAELVPKPTFFGQALGLLGSATGRTEFKTFYRFEEFFNKVSPFIWAAWAYAFAFLLCAIGWLGWTRLMNRSAYAVLWVVFLWHTMALMARIYISGRPPVTNLYSSAVFIGWGAVLLALVADYFYRNGVMSIGASVIGFSTLLIAHFLAGDGDTFQVLVAVLDTQFWLATHVTSITLGYSATYLAGLLGVLYLVRGIFTPDLDGKTDKQVTRMIYGTTCFAIFFSFIGTILGGLWADDSWGRFWGWDPKENGALLIVLWNALLLHARWDGMVKGRGLALLAIGGNVITTWSWFGVNELGVGLHSYGFTEGRRNFVLLFMLSQLVLIAVGSLPKKYWWSSLKNRPAT